ncbi:MAG: hypothetical protein HY814_13595 [Candidatus Riflebacteria bacterium]|nr:hypothetical protein [Candidatus Riflebacteria bacterium]
MTRRFFLSGFTLVDLIITLLLLVTLAGIGGFYYQEFRDSQKLAIAQNELETYCHAVSAYELTTPTPVDDQLINTYTRAGFPPLQFLLVAGTMPAINPDPWGRDYQVYPERGEICSYGPKAPDDGDLGADDICCHYTKGVVKRPTEGGGGGSLCDTDRQAPVVMEMEPAGTVDRADVPVRCTYYDNPGGSVVVDETKKKPKLYIDTEDADQAVAAGKGYLSRSANQMVYTTLAGYKEGPHTVVAQAEDGCGNVARKQWSFNVELSRVTIAWKQPTQGAQVRGTINIGASIYNQGRPIKRWTLFIDSKEIVSGSSTSATEGQELTLVPSSGVPPYDTRLVADGAHTLSLRVETVTGHYDESSNIINVDNTAPVIRQIFNQTTPGTSCLHAQRITTTVADLGARATDNYQVRNATYLIYSVDQSTGVTVSIAQGMSGPTTALPPDWTPATNPAHREDNPGALFAAQEESFYSSPRPGASRDYVPVSLSQGLYQVRFQAFDAAGNASTFATTCFYVDLQKGGIKGQAFLDGTAAKCGLSFTDDLRHIHGRLAPAGLAATAETSGRIEFSILDEGKTPVSTWEVIIDDNGPGGSSDGQFKKSTEPRDWTTGGSFLGKPAGSVVRTDLYVPDSATDSLRRGGGTTASYIHEGALTARIQYVSDTGTAHTTTTTFLIDNATPVGAGQSTFSVRQQGLVVPLAEDQILLHSSPLTAPLSGGLEFGGIWTDQPAGGLIREVRWSLTKDGQVVQDKNNLVCFPYTGSPCTTHTASFGVAAGLGPLDSGAMSITTGSIGGLDGEYRLSVSVTDGAGLTTGPAVRHFYVDTLPPEVLSVKIFKPGGAAEGLLSEVSCSVGPGTLTTAEGQALRFQPVVRDQFDIREVHYWLVPITVPPTIKSAAVVIPITGPTSFPSIPEQVVTRDTTNSPIKPLPQLYELQVEAVGANRSNPGPLCTTRVSFRFLASMAIFAPFDALSARVKDDPTIPPLLATRRTWLTSGEQADLASYLLDVFPAASTQVFDFSGRNGRAGFNPTLRIGSWLSQNASNGATDVLILLDSAPTEAITADPGVTPPLRVFFEGTGATTRQDGNVVVWVGPPPFVRAVGSEPPVVTTGTASATQAALFGADLGLDLSATNAVQRHFPAGRPLPFLPSLYEYNPFTDFLATGAAAAPNRWLRSGPHVPGSGAGDWVLDRLFSSDDATASPPRGNCFVYRNTRSQALFASFQAFGSDTLQADRNPVPPLGYVLEEFLKNFVTGNRDAAIASKKIAFSNSSATLAPITPAATSNPHDTVAYPSSQEGFTNLTTNTAASQDAVVVDLSDDGRDVAVLSKDRSKEGGPAFAALEKSLFGLDNGRVRLLAQARTTTAPIVSASRARRGGLAAVATRSDLGGVNGGADLARVGVFSADGNTGAVTPLTTGGALATDAADPAISPDGGTVAFTAGNIYDADDGAFGTAFARIVTLAGGGRGVFRATVTATGADAYRNGWVTKTFGQAPRCSRPRVAGTGTFIVFQANQVTYRSVLNVQDQIYLAAANPEPAGTPWRIGAITQDPTRPSLNPDLAESASSGMGGFPAVVFESAADYRSVRPSLVSTTDPSTSPGAVAVGSLPGGNRGIYLFSGSFAEPLVLVARGTDDHCTNPRISPDGAEVVFESAATEIVAPVMAGPATLLSHRVTNTAKRNRIYRARVRTLRTMGTEPSSIVERITPETVDVGTPARPVVSR